MTNSANIETKKIRPDERTDHAASLIEEAGKLLEEASGQEYIGSAVVHFYRTKQSLITTQKTYAMGCQVLLSQVEEGHADLGHKTLQKRMMEAYGRNAPKRVGEIETIKE
jgi:hypothetical protein